MIVFQLDWQQRWLEGKTQWLGEFELIEHLILVINDKTGAMKKTTAATYSDCKGCFRGRFSRSQGNKVGNSTISSLIVKVQLFP